MNDFIIFHNAEGHELTDMHLRSNTKTGHYPRNESITIEQILRICFETLLLQMLNESIHYSRHFKCNIRYYVY